MMIRPTSRRRRYILGRTLKRVTPATRPLIEAEIERLISLLDTADGDSDLEDGYDQEAHNGDDQGDISWPEWHTRDWRTRHGAGPELATTANFADHEDAEDDDPLEQDDPADENVLDMEMDEDAVTLSPIYGEDQSLGPINAVHANQRHDLLRQIADHSAGGDPGFVRQLRQRLRAIDARAAANA